LFNTTRPNGKARLLACALLALLAAPTWLRPAFADPCRAGPGEPVSAVRVTGDLEIVFADGRIARLVGLEASRPRGADPARAGAAAADLAQWILDAPLEWRAARPEPDRWGRTAGALFLAGPEAAGLPSLAQALVEAGHARVDPADLPPPCLAALLAAETRARALNRGLWGDPAQAALPGADASAFAGRAGQVALVEGRVAGVRESRGRVYVNFGGRGDPALVLTRQQARALERAGRPPSAWAGRVVRARGIVELRPAGPRLLPGAIEGIEVASGQAGR
jgi:hypothetical protein